MMASPPLSVEIQALISLFNQGRFTEIEPQTRSLISRYPTHPFGWQMLGAIADALGRDEEAITALQQAANLSPGDAEPHRNLGAALEGLGRFNEAEQAYRRALRIEPKFGEAHFNLGNVLRATGKADLAVSAYRAAIRFSPQLLQSHNNLALALEDTGRLAEAEETLRALRAMAPSYVEVHVNLGNVLMKQRRFPEAEACYKAALVLQPSLPEALCNLGVVLREMNRLNDAEAALRNALKFAPSHLGCLNNLGATLSDLGRPAEAIRIYRQIEMIAPGRADTCYNLAVAHCDLGQWHEAEAHYLNALALDPMHLQSRQNLASGYEKSGRLSEAEAQCRELLSWYPDLLEARIRLGIVLKMAQRHEEAELELRTVLQSAPNDARANSALGEFLAWLPLNTGERYQEGVRLLKHAVDLNPAYPEAYDNLLFAMQYAGGYSKREQFLSALDFGRAFDKPLKDWLQYANNVSKCTDYLAPHRKLRIGYVSPDFRRHAVAFFIEPILRHHDHSNFEIHCYYNYEVSDDFTERLIPLSKHWVNVARLDDNALATKIQSDGIDILIDLAGHTAANRLPLFGLKPAPVAASWIGYSTTTGLRGMDFRIVDTHTCPAGLEDAFHTERLIRLPDSFVCYLPAPNAPDVVDLPCLNGKPFTFGSFNTLSKITPAVRQLWVEVLNAVPGSRLLLKTGLLSNPDICRQVTESFAALGLAADRLLLRGATASYEEHMAQYGEMDLCLDTFPYNGGTTSFDAMWMGVPVLTVAGDSFISRMGVSLLSVVGLTDFIADSTEEFVQRAVELARQPERLKDVRLGLRQRMLASPLLDAERFTRNLEIAYREMWLDFVRRAEDARSHP